GKVIVDSFYADCKQINKESSATLSVTDLSKIDKFIEAFNAYSKDIYELTESGADFSGVARKINESDNFGGNTKSAGYTNMVDIGGIIGAGSEISSNADAALKALEDSVIYKKNGKNHSGASGLSVYYPLCVSGSQELGLFKDIALSPYYLGLVDKVAYGAVNGGIEDYDNTGILGMFSNDWSGDNYTESDSGMLEYIMEVTSNWDFADDYAPGSSSANITFDVEPGFDEDGFYSFTLSQDCVDDVDHIEGGVYLYSEEDLFAIELGSSGEVYGNFDTGEFIDGFGRFWFSLPDGQFLAAYLQENCDGYDIYTSPILLNGEETNLRFAYYYDDHSGDPGEVEIIDVWDGIDENGCAARSGRELEKGDIITPRYYLCVLDPDSDVEDMFFEGDEYKYSSKTKIAFTELDDGDYLYCFYICDIFGNYETTDYVKFTIDGDDISYDMY
ncbi:MAG: hypothetical protein K6B74_07420, partial [Ruminococcus sp.]|nr:hypothetical protein [Ruminococcus sp.]